MVLGLFFKLVAAGERCQDGWFLLGLEGSLVHWWRSAICHCPNTPAPTVMPVVLAVVPFDAEQLLQINIAALCLAVGLL